MFWREFKLGSVADGNTVRGLGLWHPTGVIATKVTCLFKDFSFSRGQREFRKGVAFWTEIQVQKVQIVRYS